MRNAVKRVTHKERSQPHDRRKLGLLEKHKDYVERAKDFHKKRMTINTLKMKAHNRNPDEFYQNMNRSKVVNGVHRSLSEKPPLDLDTLKILKSQDTGYIVHKKATDDAKIRKLQSNLHRIGNVSDLSIRKHLKFVESDNVILETEIDSKTKAELEKKIPLRIKRKIEKSYQELEQRTKRSAKLGKALKQLQLQRNMMCKGTKRKIVKNISGVEHAIVKWKRVRSK